MKLFNRIAPATLAWNIASAKNIMQAQQMQAPSLPQPAPVHNVGDGYERIRNELTNDKAQFKSERGTPKEFTLCYDIEHQLRKTPAGQENIFHRAIQNGDQIMVDQIMHCHNVVFPIMGHPNGFRFGCLHRPRNDLPYAPFGVPAPVPQTELLANQFAQNSVRHATPTMLAVLYGDEDILRAVLNDNHAAHYMHNHAGRAPVDQTPSGISPFKPLHCALLSYQLSLNPANRTRIVKMLLHKIADGRNYLTRDGGAYPRLYDDSILQRLVATGFSQQLVALKMAGRF